MDYLVKIRSVQTPLNGQFSIGANKNRIITALRLSAMLAITQLNQLGRMKQLIAHLSK